MVDNLFIVGTQIIAMPRTQKSKICYAYRGVPRPTPPPVDRWPVWRANITYSVESLDLFNRLLNYVTSRITLIQRNLEKYDEKLQSLRGSCTTLLRTELKDRFTALKKSESDELEILEDDLVPTLNFIITSQGVPDVDDFVIMSNYIGKKLENLQESNINPDMEVEDMLEMVYKVIESILFSFDLRIESYCLVPPDLFTFKEDFVADEVMKYFRFRLDHGIPHDIEQMQQLEKNIRDVCEKLSFRDIAWKCEQPITLLNAERYQIIYLISNWLNCNIRPDTGKQYSDSIGPHRVEFCEKLMVYLKGRIAHLNARYKYDMDFPHLYKTPDDMVAVLGALMEEIIYLDKLHEEAKMMAN